MYKIYHNDTNQMAVIQRTEADARFDNARAAFDLARTEYSQGHYIMGSGEALAKRQLISTCHNFLYVFPPSCQLYITSGHPG